MVAHDAFAAIGETIARSTRFALARVVLTNRDNAIALEAREKGLMGMLLRYPFEVRDASEYFDNIHNAMIKDMLNLERHVMEQKSGHFEPEWFAELLAKKQKGSHCRGEEGSAQHVVTPAARQPVVRRNCSGEKKATRKRKAG